MARGSSKRSQSRRNAPSGNRATATDRHVGRRIRERRIMLGLSQQQMAEMIGVTYQQAHKYERGINRISAGRLFEIAQALRVPVGQFFEGLGEGNGDDRREMNPRHRMCLELARNFAQIDNQRHQEALSQMARALADSAAAPLADGGGKVRAARGRPGIQYRS
jgi:transcriptional regulator with XRE-family HTH domain